MFRLIIAIASMCRMTLISSDFVQAFTNAPLKDNIYISTPDGLIQYLYPNLPPGDYVIRLNRALYGLRQSAFLWQETLAESFVNHGFIRLDTEPCLFFKHDNSGTVITGCHVDDSLSACTPILEQSTITTLKGMFDCSEPITSPSRFLHWDLSYSAQGIHLSVETFLKKAAETITFNSEPLSLYPVYSPSAQRAEFDPKTATPTDSSTLKHFQSVLGCCTYATYAVRPDTAFYTSELASVTQPSQKHIGMAHQLFRYLYHTRTMGILYPNRSTASNLSLLSGASDSDHAGCPVTRRSQSGAVIFFNDSPIEWLSKKQQGVPVTSASDAELAAMVPLASRLDHFQYVISQLGFDIPCMTLRSDSQVSAHILNGPSAAKNRTSSIRVANLKHYVDHKIINIVHVASKQQPCDILTKPMAQASFIEARQVIPIVDRPLTT
jgi:hypothetical protein